MYLYFDTQGNLKEQINDQALRQGNSNINYLYVYWEKSEDNENITALWARFKADSETIVPSSTTWITSDTYVEQTIPYDKSRDLKFFNYFKTYKFYVIQLPDAVLGQSGAWLGTLQFVETNSITTLGQLAFYVSASNASVEADENINIAQWNYLIKYISELEDEYSSFVTESELENAIDNAMANVYKYEGSGTVSDLNTFIANFTQDKNILKGWVFNVTNSGDLINSTGTTSVIAGDNVAFEIINPVTQTYRWDKFAGTIDLSNYALKSELPTKTSDLTNDSNFQNQTQVQTAINNALTRVYKFQGSISVSDLNDYIASYTGDKNNLNGWVYNITDSGNLNNSTGTTQVNEGDNVAFYVYNTSQQLYEWDKLAGTIDVDSIVFNVIERPSSTTLTESEMNAIIKGAIIRGGWSAFGTSNDTIFFPPLDYSGTYRGLCFYGATIGSYYINQSTRAISLNSSTDTIIKQLAQVITQLVDFGNNAKINRDSSDRVNILYGNSAKVKVGSTDTLFANRVTPDSSNTYDLGRSGVYWKDLYLAGALKDGTNEVPIADINAGVKYQTTAPSANNTSGLLKFVVLSSEPSTYYDGYYYIITQSATPVTTYNTIHLKRYYSDGTVEYKLNDGSAVTLSTSNQELTLNNVSKLEVYMSCDDIGQINVDTSSFKDRNSTGNLYETSNTGWTDITQYLQEGCYVSIHPHD